MTDVFRHFLTFYRPYTRSYKQKLINRFRLQLIVFIVDYSVDYFLCSSIRFLVCKMLENGEKYRSVFPEAQDDVPKCFVCHRYWVCCHRKVNKQDKISHLRSCNQRVSLNNQWTKQLIGTSWLLSRIPRLSQMLRVGFRPETLSQVVGIHRLGNETRNHLVKSTFDLMIDN